MSLVTFTIEPPGGAEVALDRDRILYSTARFTSSVNGAPGDFFLQVRDLGHTENFVTGAIIRLYVDGVVKFGGFLLLATRTWPFPVLDTTNAETTPRYWELSGTDWNILWSKRRIYDSADLTHVYKLYAAGSYDDDILNDILANYTDIGDVCPTSAIDRVGVAVLDIPSIMSAGSSLGGAPWQAGDTLRDAFYAVSRTTGGIFYITPAGVITYCDADTATNAYDLSDTPSAGQIGYRLLKITLAGDQLVNDAIVWGAALGSDQIVVSRVEDATSIAAHGRWQKGLYSGGLYRQTSADLIANTMVYGTPASLRGAKDDKVLFVCTVNGALFGAGEKVRCISNVFGFDTVLPVRKVTYVFPTPTDVFSELSLSYEIDAAWSIVEQMWQRTDGQGRGGFRIPPLAGSCGITDSFNRPNQTNLGLSDSGLVWDDFGEAGKSILNGRARISGPTGAELNFGFDLDPLAATWIWRSDNDEPATEFHFGVGGLGELHLVVALDSPGGAGELSLQYDSGAYTRVPFDYVPGIYYHIRVAGSASELTAKIWKTTEAEPAWMITVIPTGAVRFHNLFFFTSTITTTPLIYLEDLDITGINRCMCLPLTDSFDRVVGPVDGLNDPWPPDGAWGDADVGLPWLWGGYNQPFDPDWLAGVDGDFAYFALAGSGEEGGFYLDLPSVPARRIEGTFKVSRLPASGSSFVRIKVITGSGANIVVFRIGPTNKGVYINDDTGLNVPGIPPFTYVAGTVYRYVIEADSTRRVTVWPDGQVQPVTPTITKAGGAAAFGTIELYANMSWASGLPAPRIAFGELNVGPKSTCIDLFGPILPYPPSGEIIVTGNGVITSIVTLPRAYLAGSTRLWINGTQKYLGADYTETDPDNGIITLATALTSLDDVVRVAFIANGPYPGTA